MCSRTIDLLAVLSVDKELAIVPATPLSHAEGAEIQPALPHPSSTKVVLESLIGVLFDVPCVVPVFGGLCVQYMRCHPLNLL